MEGGLGRLWQGTKQRELLWMMNPTGDARIVALCNWLTRELHQLGPFAIELVSGDASFRRYFRVIFEKKHANRIAMDAPPGLEPCQSFVNIAGFLSNVRGVHIPRIFAQDHEQGFLLLEDLGAVTFLNALGEYHENREQLYEKALCALIELQKYDQRTSEHFPIYTEQLLRKELHLFLEWFVVRHLGVQWTKRALGVWQRTTQVLIEHMAHYPKVFVHRDFHSRNLIFRGWPQDLGVLDFQDAVWGPISYDVVSLLKDAYVPSSEEQVWNSLMIYWQLARENHLPVPSTIDEMYRDVEWAGLQRHFKIAGIFARLYLRDGKNRYLQDIPLVCRYLYQALSRYEVLSELHDLVGPLILDSTGERVTPSN